jgi:hypothetical protein
MTDAYAIMGYMVSDPSLAEARAAATDLFAYATYTIGPLSGTYGTYGLAQNEMTKLAADLQLWADEGKL